MSEDKTYQGWTNYETWAVALWLNNEQGDQEWARGIALDTRNDELWQAGEAFKTSLDEMMPDLGATLWSDLLRSAFDEVNWAELAASFREDLED